MSNIIPSLLHELRKYRRLGEIAMAQLRDDELHRPLASGGNTAAALVCHVSGNLKSRFTDFLTTDGEKPWRNKPEEFNPPRLSRAELLARWEEGWHTLDQSLESLIDTDLDKTVLIAGEPHRVDQALHRTLAHTSYHVGQLVLLAKSVRGADWKGSKSFAETR